MLQRLLGSVAIRQGEAPVAFLMFAYSFLAMTAHNIIRPLTRSKFIADLGADNIPYVELAAGLAIGVLMLWYTSAIRRLPRRHVIRSRRQGWSRSCCSSGWPCKAGRRGPRWPSIS
jgi:ATP/ADP translocase